MRKRILIFLLTVLLVISVPAHAISFGWLFGGGKEKAGAVAESSIKDDGILRVWLKSLKDPEALNLTFDGVYTVENDAGFRFDRGTEVILTVQKDSVCMTVGGLTIDMGSGVTFTRHAVAEGETNGIYIRQSEKNALYTGDLNVTIANGGLRSILSVPVEEYLYGVVAYEMSDSWPIEALKAQAVAARTYALNAKWNAGGREYDVVDTTQDQVYKGFIPDYENVITAVKETCGMVGVYNGSFATCYYTASNGGQTAMPGDVWGGSGDFGYLARTEDPYDLENPSSLVNSLTVSSTGEGSEKLWGMLTEALEKLDLPYKNIRLERVKDVEPVSPKAEGSLMYTELRFTLEVSAEQEGYASAENDELSPLFTNGEELSDLMLGSLTGLSFARSGSLSLPFVYQAVRTVLPEDAVVELSVYDQIKDGLSLGINGSDYEVISVEKSFDEENALQSFTLSMRRFGHGVGMSQRGAQQMAGEHGKTCMEILNFYYPGMSVEKIVWDTPELTKIEALPESIGRARATPAPTPSPKPLPPLEAGEYYASVLLESRVSTLNVREEPSTAARIIQVLDFGRRVIVVEEAPDGWVKIRTAEFTGYVKLEYLKAE